MNKTSTKVQPKKTAVAHVKNIRISPRKMRLVTNLVKNMWAYEAITQLEFTPKKASRFVIDLLRSGMANAENNFKMDKDNLYIVSITCDAGSKIKRYMPRAQGRASEIRRPLSHIHVVLGERTGKRKGAKFAAAGTKQKAASGKKAEETTAKTAAEEKKPAMHNQIEKTEQQSKMNKVQNKRRLFNRKSGV